MKVISQNSALQSWEKALHHQSIELEGRNTVDRLKFLSDFSTLINFYDLENKKRQNWSRFLLKDPVILLASIASTDYTPISKLFYRTVSNTHRLIELKEAKKKNVDDREIGNNFNQLFDQLTDLFIILELWTSYMKEFHHDYDLKHYIFKQLKEKYGPYFWSLLSFRQALHSLDKPLKVDAVKYYLFEDYDQKVWRNHELESFWEFFGLDHIPKLNEEAFNQSSFTNGILLIGLEAFGQEILKFLKTIIKEAKLAYLTHQKNKSKYPDTILLRAFSELLNVYKHDFNQLNKKHLNFYFKSILKQKKQNATADKAYAFTKLGNNISNYSLSEGTLFKAGLDTNKQPILFESLKTTEMNAATISDAYTLSKQSDGVWEKLMMEEIKTPSELTKDENGQTKHWATFGGDADAKAQNMGIAIASPIFLLNEGSRTITLLLDFESTISLELLSKANFYLSTNKGWLPQTSVKVTAAAKTVNLKTGGIIDSTVSNYNQAIVCIEIDESVAAICPMAKNPDGYTSNWPLLKIEFSQFVQLDKPPVLKQLDIYVSVLGVKSLELYNDSGKLSPKKPFLPFGPTPKVNSNFFIGSAEIFSKPLEVLNFNILWNALPKDKDFSKYYYTYNSYLNQNTQNMVKNLFVVLRKYLAKKYVQTWNFIKSIFVSFEKELIKQNQPFNNFCFELDAEFLQNGNWSNTFNFQNTVDATSNQPLDFAPYAPSEDCIKKIEGKNNSFNSDSLQLFRIDNTNCLLTDDSNFTHNGTSEVDLSTPDLQLSALTYSDATTNGFVRLSLSSPEYGFGLDLYPKVITDIALKNAVKVVKKKPVFKEAPNAPFSPKIKTFTANYRASVTYDFTQHQTGYSIDYPIECYTYSPFQTFKIFAQGDASQTNVDYTNYHLLSSYESSSTGLPLHLPFHGKGALLFALENLEGNDELNLWFQLSRKTGQITKEKSPIYSYLSDEGWSEATLLADQTNQYKCSGIVQLTIGDDVQENTVYMPTGKSWVSIAVCNDPTSYAGTICVNNNGIELQRTGTNFLKDTSIPQIDAAAISGPNTAIPEIASISQLFPSFGGRKAEEKTDFFQRISNRIASKGRIAKEEDYFRFIQQNFPDIYYSQTVWENSSIVTYLVEKVDDATLSHAFLPLVSDCTEIEVSNALKEQTSAFANVQAKNYTPNYVAVEANIQLQEGIAIDGFDKKLTEGLNLFLSPWIESEQSQRNIDEPITSTQLIAYIQTFSEVQEVNDVLFIVYENLPSEVEIVPLLGQTKLTPKPPILYVSAMKHHLNITNSPR